MVSFERVFSNPCNEGPNRFCLVLSFCLLLMLGIFPGCDATNQNVVEKAGSPQQESRAEGSERGRAGRSSNSPALASGSKDISNASIEAWHSLFDHKQLGNWKPTNFGAEAEVKVEAGVLRCEMGYPMTGVTWTSDKETEFELPVSNYEISLEAQRVDGDDFFCGLTFPVNDSHCSLIVGGWGGTLVGLSCIDGDDASRNDTKLHRNFENGQWYRIRVRVLPNRIKAAIDDKWVIDRDISGAEISVRSETLKCRPLGLCCFDSVAQFNNIKIRRIKSIE